MLSSLCRREGSREDGPVDLAMWVAGILDPPRSTEDPLQDRQSRSWKRRGQTRDPEASELEAG